MEFVYVSLFFIYGVILGSFFNVVGLRVPLKQSIVKPPSHCPTCEKRLSAIDLIPVLSYVILRGKCRNCQQKISPVYPLMEFVTGSLFAFSYWMLGFQGELLVALLLISLLVMITVSDISTMLIPNKILLPFGILLFIARVLIPLTPWWDSLLGAVVGFSILFFIALISKGGMGGGDIKLFFVLGLVLGTMNTIVTLFLASIIGAIVGLWMMRKQKTKEKTPIPFGPSISLAAIVVYFYGSYFVEWYTALFF